MKYLFDTNVCIKFIKGNSKNILEKTRKIGIENIIINSVVRYELYYGAYKSQKKEETIQKLQSFLNSFSNISFDENASKLCGRIRADLEQKGNPIGPYDIMIASISLANNLILIMHNTKEFSRIKNLKFEDWEI